MYLAPKPSSHLLRGKQASNSSEILQFVFGIPRLPNPDSSEMIGAA